MNLSLWGKYLTNLLHKIHYHRSSPNTSWPDNHSIWHRRDFPIFNFFSGNFFVWYFYNHWSHFKINTISLKFLFCKSCDSFVKPAKQKLLEWAYAAVNGRKKKNSRKKILHCTFEISTICIWQLMFTLYITNMYVNMGSLNMCLLSRMDVQVSAKQWPTRLTS